MNAQAQLDITITRKPRPVLRYHGGKWMLAPWIIAHLPPHKVYVEPFGGAASVLLRKPRSYSEVYNDLDGEIVNVFRFLQNRDSALDLERLLRVTPYARQEFVAAYDDCDDPLVRAQRVIIRSFMGFGSDAIHRRSGFRSNANRSGTTPGHDWRNYADCLAFFTARLQGVVIENRHAMDVIAQHDQPATLIYADPPYVHSTRRSDKRYRHEMTDVDHRFVASFLREAKGMVIVSGYESTLYRDLYPDWKSVKRRALADGARPRTQVLWFNPRAWEQLHSAASAPSAVKGFAKNK